MTYLTDVSSIQALIADLSSCSVLWLDTEVADWQTSKPKLSLIQVLAHCHDLTGKSAYILDVLDQPDLIQYFVDQIMTNTRIEKVFHNSGYDLRFLGKPVAQNVTCTLKLAKSIPLQALGTPDRKLKTLAAKLCGFSDVDQEQQGSDWGKRPLSERQLMYARMDTVYLAQVHQHLLKLTNQEPDKPVTKPSENTSFSVTKVRLAFECPRLFYLAHHFGGMTLFLPDGQAFGVGSAFHDLSARFVQTALNEPQFKTLLEPKPEQLKIDSVSTTMRELFYSLAFFPYLQSAIQENPSKAQALAHLWQGLTGLIDRWAKLLVNNRRYCKAEEVIGKTFLAQELTVQHEFALPDGSCQLVRGRFDSLVYDFEHQRLQVVEYKTYQSPDQSAELAQVALYSYMLKEKVGVPINSAVYSVLPDWRELTFSWDELEKTVHQLIPHKLKQMRQWAEWQQGQPNPPSPTAQPDRLCDICPQKKKCQTLFVVGSTLPIDLPPPPKLIPPEPTPSPPIAPPPTSSTPDADAMGERLVETLRAFGVGVDYQGAAVGPAFVRVKLKPNMGVKVSSILRSSDDLRVQLGLANSPLIAPQAGYVSVDLPRSDRQTAYFDEYIRPQTQSPADPTRIAIGINLDGQLVEADLSDPNTCHFLVGGTTGSGKSEFLRSLLLSLTARHTPDQLKIALVDPKRVTFPEFDQMAWLYTPIAKDSDRAIEVMEDLVGEMDSRYQKFEMQRCNDLSSYNQKFIQQPAKLLPRIVCIFDEYADFMAEKEIAKELEFSIKRLGAMARAAGIHLIIATQRPEAKIVTPVIRSNLPGRVALRTASEADSAIVLGGKQIEAAHLLGKGDLLYLSGGKLLRLQSLFAPEKTILSKIQS
ncbi:PD-(D/E)XK nuclease family protein [Leptolyngbya sp. FACHB-671]|uniref:DNA translocase FtsK n=1 Tax=Leptolyngbya sp. FACHB-671 TaxID=2692812 RepID=UPI0016859937|nr:DNA translocase FtsK [Leptolyngbya sp. FACHB-671]MBD2068798.1 PD-(D/E)XK nuclease family protein [Leptolyngbya sp. FACHB-671]